MPKTKNQNLKIAPKNENISVTTDDILKIFEPMLVRDIDSLIKYAKSVNSKENQLKIQKYGNKDLINLSRTISLLTVNIQIPAKFKKYQSQVKLINRRVMKDEKLPSEVSQVVFRVFEQIAALDPINRAMQESSKLAEVLRSPQFDSLPNNLQQWSDYWQKYVDQLGRSEAVKLFLSKSLIITRNIVNTIIKNIVVMQIRCDNLIESQSQIDQNPDVMRFVTAKKNLLKASRRELSHFSKYLTSICDGTHRCVRGSKIARDEAVITSLSSLNDLVVKFSDYINSLEGDVSDDER